MKIFSKEEKPKKKHLSKAKKEKLRLKEKEELKREKEERKNRPKRFDLKPLFGGLAVGIANIIPGVSGGTMLVIFDLFERLTNSISDLFKKGSTTRKQSFIFLLKVAIGAVIGIVGFAKILGFTLTHLEAETIFWFMGLILFSVPIIIKNELKGEKFNIIFFLIGALIIGVLEYFNLNGGLANTGESNSILNYLIMVGLGAIGGISMIFPGISGSMVMLVLGKYEMIRGYIDKVTTFDINIYVKLAVFAIGAILGVIISSKILSKLLTKHRGKTISLILGFIIASALILPLNLETKITLSTEKICGLIISFVFGGIVIYYLDKLEKKNSD
ncbi:MAG: DUF368 domain-containing protein [Bacilli bacterium]|nr:DUF368 domain-containing protein [Bacilli bacterium]